MISTPIPITVTAIAPQKTPGISRPACTSTTTSDAPSWFITTTLTGWSGRANCSTVCSPVAELSQELVAAGFEVIETHTRTACGARPHGAITARRQSTR